MNGGARVEEIGSQLKQAREAKGLSLAQAEEETKIRRKYLAALEQGLVDELPGEVYLKGFLRSYANFLGLDGAGLVEQYKHSQRNLPSAAAEVAPAAAPPPVPPPPIAAAAGRQPPERRVGASMRALRPSPAPSAGRPWLPIVIMLVIGGVVAGIFAFGRGSPDEVPVNTPPPSASGPPPPQHNPEPASEPPPAETPPVEPAPPPAEVIVGEPMADTVPVTVSPGPIELTLTWRSRAWVRLTVDGIQVEEATLETGAVRNITAEQEVRVRLGHTEVVDFTINGQSLGPLAREPQRTVVITAASP